MSAQPWMSTNPGVLPVRLSEFLQGQQSLMDGLSMLSMFMAQSMVETYLFV
jgi:hypothetical protein